MPPEHAPEADDAALKLVVVTGSGRSGTSTVAGALKMLGSWHVPQPEISPNDANPRGYFEPKWAVAYHKKVLAEAGVRTLDGRPVAAELMRSVTGREDLLEELRDWFSTQMQGTQVVVKDPRIVWLRDMWSTVASDLGAARLADHAASSRRGGGLSRQALPGDRRRRTPAGQGDRQPRGLGQRRSCQ